MRTFLLAFYVSLIATSIASAAMNANPGINYSGRIMSADGTTPITSTNVTFSLAIYDVNHSCRLYTETRSLDLSVSAGTFSFDIGDGAATTSSFNGNVSNIYDLFNNNKAFTGLTCTAPHTGFTAATANEPRIMMVSFDAGDGSGVQNLPALKINPVPAALQAYKLNGYGTGDLLRIDSSVDKTTNANTDLTQSEYDEFWRLIKNPNTAYLSSSTSLAGDVTGPFATNTVAKIQGVAVSGAAPTNGQILMYSGGAWTPITPAPSGVASVTASLPLSVSGSSTANISISKADTTHDGYLAQGDWNTFNNKQSSTLANGKIWVGNSGNVATEVTMSGDVSIDNAGAASLATTGVAAGTYSKVTVDTKGRVTQGASLGSADIISMLGYTPVNKAGDVMAGNLSLQSVTSDPVGLLAGDEGKMWYRSDLNTVRYWDGSSAISLGVAGAGMQSLNGLTATAQSFVTGTGGADFNISSSGSDHTFNIPTASATNRGALSPTDWATFNAKMGTALSNGKVWVGNASGVATPVALSGDATIDNAGVLSIGAGKITAPMLSSGGINAATSGVVIAGPAGNLVNLGCATSGHVLKWTVTGWTCAFPDPSLPNLSNGKLWVGNSGNAATEVALSGDVSIDNAGVATLANSGVAAGTYSKVTVDAKGRVTVGGTIASADITAALGYTPVNKAGDVMLGNLSLNSVTSDPAGLVAGDEGKMWYRSDLNVIRYWDGSAAVSLGVAGAGITNINGLTAGTQSFVLGTAGTDVGINSAGSAHTFNIPTASASNRGALSSSDWTAFNSKQTNSLASAKVWVGNASGGAAPVSVSGDATVDNAGALTLATSGVTAGTYNKVTVDAKGRVTAGAALAASDLPALNSAKVWVGNSGNAATPVSVTGDVSMDNAGVTTLASSGVTAGTYSKVTVDAKGRVTAGASLVNSDITSALGYTPVNKAGDTMGGALAMSANDITNTGNLTMAANKYFGLSANSTNGTVAGQMWYDTGTIKYYDGSTVKSLGVAGAGITTLNGLSTATQSFVLGTAGTDIGISSGGSAHTFNIPTASASNRGALSSADWTTFNSKQTNSLSSGQMWLGNASNVATAVTMSGDATITNAGVLAIGAAKITAPMLSSGSPIVATTGVVTADATGNLGRFTCSTSGHVATWSVTGWSCAAPAAVLPSLASTNIWVGNASGGPAAVAMSGDATMANTGAVTLASSGVTAGTYSKVTVDSKGRVTVGGTIASGDITSALGYTPVNKAGDTMGGALAMGANDITNAGNITMAANKYFGLSANSTNGTVAGQMWYDTGTIKYYDGSTVKSLGVAGAGITSLNGLSTGTQSFVTGTAGTDFGITSVGSAHTFNIPTASASNRGALSSADWTTFNSKQTNSLASAKVWVGNASGGAAPVSVSGDATVDNAGALTLATSGVTAGTYNKVTVDAKGRVTAGASLAASDLPALNSAKVWVGNSGNVAAAVSVTGDVSMDNAGVTTLASSGVAAGTYAKVAVDAKGRVTSGLSMNAADITAALTYTPVNKAGDTMGGALAMGANDITNTGNLTMAANKYFGLSANSTNGTVAGQMWYDTGTIKYYDGTSVKSLGVAGAGITSLNGLSTGTQSFVTGTAGTDFGITSVGSAHTFNIPTASASNRGALSSADWTTFNSKMSNALTSGQMWLGNASNVATAVTMSGDATITNAGVLAIGAAKITGPMLSSGSPIVATTGVVTADATGNLGRFTCSTSGHVATWSVTGWSCAAPAAVLPSLASTNIWVGNASGGPAAVAMSGDATMANTGAITLASSGVAAGTYAKVAVDAKGRVTSGLSMNAADITAALTYTPVNKAGDTMGGALAMGANDITNTGNITMAANKYFGLSANSTNGTVAGQMWYDTGTIKYYDGTSVKSLGVAGAGITTLNGLSTGTQSFVTGTAGTDFGITSVGSAHTFNIPTASASNRGALSSADWTTFNSKQTNSLASAKVWVGNASGGAAPVSVSGDATVDNAGALTLATSGVTAGTYNKVTVDAKGRVTAGAVLAASDLPALNSAKVWVGNSGNAATPVSVTGDVSMDNAGVTTLASSGVTAGTYAKVAVDAKGRVTSGLSMNAADITAALTYTPVNKAGDTMGGALAMGANDITNTGNLTMAANKYFGLSANSTNGNVAGQMWYDTGTIKYYDGTSVKSLGVAGAGITSLNGLSTATQSFVTGTAGTDFGISSTGSAHTFNIPTASASNRGALSSTDWTTFNSKQTNSLASAKIWVGNASGGAAPVSMSGDATIDNAGALAIGNAKITGPMLSSGSPIVATTGVVTADATGNLGRFTCSTSGHVATWSVTGWSCAAPTAALPSLASTNLWVGNASGGPAAVAMSGDATMANTGAVTLTSSGVTAGTYTKVTVDAKGRVTAGASLASSDVTTALGFTPAAANSGFSNGGNSFGATATLGTNDAYDLAIETNNSTKMTIQSGGNVGIGTAAPGSKLTVAGGDASINGVTIGMGAGSIASNTAAGSQALFANTTGNYNTASGIQTLRTNTTGSNNTAHGAQALYFNNSGSNNTAVGMQALYSNVSGGGNTATGQFALTSNTGNYNTANGGQALFANTVGSGNTASGYAALQTLSGGGNNTAYGYNAGYDLSSANGNIILGAYPTTSVGVTTGSYNILIGYDVRPPVQTSSNQLNIGNLIYANGLATGATLSTGNVGVGTSSPNTTLDINGAFSQRGMSAPAVSVAGQGRIYFDSTANKFKVSQNNGAYVDLVSSGGITSLNGLSTATQTFGTGTTGTDFNIASSGSGHIFHLPTASASNRGALSSADWTTFNSKMSNALTSGQMWIGNASNIATAVTMSGDATISNAGVLAIGAAKITGPMLSSGSPIIATTGVVTADATGNLGRFTCSTSGHVATWSVTGWSCAAPTAVLPSLASTNLWVGNASGGPAAVAMSGDATMSNAGAVTLASSGVTAGTYSKVTVDAKGRVTAGASLASADVTTALGFTPASTGSVFVQNGNSFAATAVLGTNDANDLAFKTNNATKMTIQSGGNVGIGLTNPTNLLDIQGSGLAFTRIKSTTNTGAAGFQAVNDASSTIEFGRYGSTHSAYGSIAAGDAYIYGNTGGFSIAADSASGLIKFATGASVNERMRIDSTGKVGIGTTNPVSTLHVAGNTLLGLQGGVTDDNAEYILKSNGQLRIQSNQSGSADTTWVNLILDAGTSTSANSALIMNTIGAERMRIDSSGNVGIGTSTPSVALDVNGGVRAGSSGVVSTCGLGQANGEGTQRYNYTTHNMEFCNGSGWVPLRQGTTALVGTLKMAGASSCVWTSNSTSWTTVNTAVGACNTPTVTGSVTSPGKYPAISIASLPAGNYEVTFIISGLWSNSSSYDCHWRISDGTNSSGTVDYGLGGNIVHGMFSYGTAQSNITFNLQTVANSGGVTCNMDITSAVRDYMEIWIKGI